MDNAFICGLCHETYDKKWSDAEAKKEAEELWGDIPDEETAVVCDDCFNLMFHRNL